MKSLSVFQAFRILGITDREQMKAFVLKFTRPEWHHRVLEIIHMSLVDLFKFTNDLATLAEIRDIKPEDDSEQTQKESKDIFTNELFPHLDPVDIKPKLDMLSLMIARYAEYLAGLRKLDDRDHLGNKRFESAGKSMETLFNGLFKNMLNALVTPKNRKQKKIKPTDKLDTPFETLAKTLKTGKIKDDFIVAFNRASSWGVPGHGTNKENIVEELKRDNAFSPYIQLSKLNTPTTDKGRIMNVRAIHTSQLGYVCPAHTPEGTRCGLVKHLALTNWISIDSDENIVISFVSGELASDPTREKTTVFWLNGKIKGWCDGKALYKALLHHRRSGGLAQGTTVVLDDDNILHVYTDAGRPTRPLLVMNEEGKLVIDVLSAWDKNFHELVALGCVEYIDALEADYIRIVENIKSLEQRQYEIAHTRNMIELYTTQLASNFNDKLKSKVRANKIQAERALKQLIGSTPYTHCEINPQAYLGIAASFIPFSNHNPGARTAYGCGHVTQALGVAHSNVGLQFDSTMKVLAFPSAPLVMTETQDIFGITTQPMGHNVIVAFMIYGGYNQEDSIIMSKGAIDRGLFRMLVYKSYFGQCHSNMGERFQKPEPRAGEEDRYAALNDDGTPIIGAPVREDDYIIGIVRQTPNGLANMSVKAGVSRRGIIDSLYQSG